MGAVHDSRELALFQSSPTSKGGRYTGFLSKTGVQNQFQSSPTSKGGRYRHAAAAFQAAMQVSILAHL